MTGKEIIQLIKKHELENYEIDFVSTDFTDKNHVKHEIIGIGDIGHSDKITTFLTVEK